MGTYAVDSTKQALRATGIVEPVMEWAEMVDGKRKRTDNQAVNDRGVPLYGVEVSYISENFGRMSTVVAKVMVPATQAPQVEAYEVINFQGLEVSVRPNRAGGLVESWRAEGIAGAAGRKSEQGS